MNTSNDEAIKVRVPSTIKARLQTIAEAKLCSISDVAREALLEYLARQIQVPKSSSSRYPAHQPELNESREIPTSAALPTAKKKRAA